MRIMGIDPGYERLGIAIIDGERGKETLLHSECFLTSGKKEFAERVKEVGLHINELIKEWGPDRVALETLFFAKNQKTAMMVAGVRGVLLYELAKAKMPIFEYAPVEIKVAVTSYGKSEKKEIGRMVERLIAINKKIKYDDEYDAIATALTCSARERV